jgi:hypothetical protein
LNLLQFLPQMFHTAFGDQQSAKKGEDTPWTVGSGLFDESIQQHPRASYAVNGSSL